MAVPLHGLFRLVPSEYAFGVVSQRAGIDSAAEVLTAQPQRIPPGPSGNHLEGLLGCFKGPYKGPADNQIRLAFVLLKVTAATIGAQPKSLRKYIAENGLCPFDDWLLSLRDKQT